MNVVPMLYRFFSYLKLKTVDGRMATASITTAGMNRIRSRSDYALSDGISSVSEELHVQRDADQVVSPVHTHGGISIPSSSRARFPPTRHSSDDEEECEMQMYSTSYAGPHDYVNYTFKYVVVSF